MTSFRFTKEGLPIDSKDDKGRVIAAMGAALLHISEKFLKEYAYGKFKRILIHTEKEIIMLSEKDDNGVLSVLKGDSSLS